MNRDQQIEMEYAQQLAVQQASFVATLAFGRQVLWMLFMASAGAWYFFGTSDGLHGVAWTILATGAAYLSQTAATHNCRRLAQCLQALSIICAFLALMFLMAIAPLGA